MVSISRAKAIQKAHNQNLFAASGQQELIDRIKQNLLADEKILGVGRYGVVLKEQDQNKKPIAVKITSSSPLSPFDSEDYLSNEVDALAIASELGISPKILSSTKIPHQTNNSESIGIIEMEYLDPNRFKAKKEIYPSYDFEESKDKNNFLSDTNQQIASLLINNTYLGDRHGNNVLVDTETGLPVQIDFGSAHKLSDEESVIRAANIIHNDMMHRGQEDEADILYGIIEEMINKKEFDEAKFHLKEGLDILGRTPMSEAPASPKILNDETSEWI